MVWYPVRLWSTFSYPIPGIILIVAAVFLRILEYYEGIMFLTTNRISTFDAAFKSRIHVAIKYRALSASSRRDVWKTFARKASPNSAIHWMDDQFVDTLSAKDLNGRQIKNIMRTADALAVSSNETIGKRHVETAIGILEEFERDFEEDAAADPGRMGGHGMLEYSRGPKRRRVD
jgi:AAA+ superfamily predicted ATPase